MNELKQCPFCGAPAKRSVQAASSYSPGSYKCAAYCTRGSCGAAINLIYHPPLWIKNPERQAKATITRTWNRRADDGKAD